MKFIAYIHIQLIEISIQLYSIQNLVKWSIDLPTFPTILTIDKFDDFIHSIVIY